MRFLGSLSLLVTLVTAALWSRLAFAQGVPDASAPSCVEAQRKAQSAERALRSCEVERERASNDLGSCRTTSTEETAKAAENEGRAKTCETSRETLCSSVSTFTEDLLSGKVSPATCVSDAQRKRLRDKLGGWDAAAAALGQLGTYGLGASDVLPFVHGQSAGEKQLARLLGSGQREPLLYRRLLTEALHLTAPESFASLRAGGVTSMESWFSSDAPLDPKLVQEAQRERKTDITAASGPLSTALRLVQAYAEILHCYDSGTTLKSCRRAKQLEQLLESAGPLLVRRRIEEIWATECGELGKDQLKAWLADVPGKLEKNKLDTVELSAAAHGKLFSCYLVDASGAPSFEAWAAERIPRARDVPASSLSRFDAIQRGSEHGSPEDTCGRAVRAMQSWPQSSMCTAPPRDVLEPIRGWAAIATKPQTKESRSAALQMCRAYARLVWEGRAAFVPTSFSGPPKETELVRVDEQAPETRMASMRRACRERRGTTDTFPNELRTLAALGRGLGDAADEPPWRTIGPTDTPAEAPRFVSAVSFASWGKHFFVKEAACSAMGLGEARCVECNESRDATLYDCALVRTVDASWSAKNRGAFALLVTIAAALALVRWGTRLHRARICHGTWARDAALRLSEIGLPSRRDPWRALFPSRYDTLHVALPGSSVWTHWGGSAIVVRVAPGSNVTDADVHDAARKGLRARARVVFVVHEASAALSLPAVRAVLEWAAKGGAHSLHILPISADRLAWAQSAADLLDLVEDSSLRANPFEVRGRITTAGQFWNRERLVSGLLASARSGQWVVVTGLRRFGKSSLALEVARRIPGPSAYVDLAGFHEEIVLGGGGRSGATSILRFLTHALVESARALDPEAALPDAPSEVEAADLTRFFRDLSRAFSGKGKSPPMLIVLDELEHMLGRGPERLHHALDVLATVLGRLRTAIGDSPNAEGAPHVGLVICSTIHPLLWAPLRTLTEQSLMGAFTHVCVPTLDPDVAKQMMRGLGAPQGIRFGEEALELLVAEAHGVPLLLRRLGTAVLELYDVSRARQGTLGAVEVGVAGVREALAKEARPGAPLRTWIESEIAPPSTPAGAMLHLLARKPRVDADELRRIAEMHVAADFEATGITRNLAPAELRRRAAEAASVMLQVLTETGLLIPFGDITHPEAYELPQGMIRRILAEDE